LKYGFGQEVYKYSAFEAYLLLHYLRETLFFIFLGILTGNLFLMGTFHNLDDYYKCFTFAVGPNPKKKFALRITDGETIKNCKDGMIMDCYVSLGLFGWWKREKEGKDDNVYMYFDDKIHIMKAKRWLEDKFSDTIQVCEVQEQKEYNPFKR
jgi:hypothetical protein